MSVWLCSHLTSVLVPWDCPRKAPTERGLETAESRAHSLEPEVRGEGAGRLVLGL